MRGSEPATARQEAERLVAAVLAALADRDPAAVQKLASRAGDLAAGLARLLRSTSAAWPGSGGAGPADEVWRAATRAGHGSGGPGPADEVWRAATRAGQAGPPRESPDDVWAAATRPAGDGDQGAPQT